VDEHGVAEAGGDDQLVAEVVARPAQDVERVSILETGSDGREVDRVEIAHPR
jgi:hypothetical protein